MLTGIKALFGGGSATAMREATVRCANPQGLHRMAYTEWGDPENPDVLMCVHGLTRNGRDFDALADALSAEYRVICPDVVGRGRSDWLPANSAYGLPQYVSDMMVLLARSGAESVHWVGTSMGGLIGMAIASQPDSPITRLVLNDVGPVITAASLQRIGDYVGKAPVFPDFAAAEHYIRAVSAPFGPLTDAQWQHLTQTSLRACDGGYEMRYDPAIGDVFRAAPVLEDVDLWPIYDAIRCPTLVLRGAQSDLLTPETHHEMGQRGPKAKLLEVSGVGHAPMLMDAAQIALIQDFLLTT
ncbi:alpha/beta fold hydrolase [Niveibacterium sp.]|uniref:alpha/beta fold hydrolase n=1 Tax=Niveibacterium sp. TaxID=2017444 RepID=UPI0035B33DCC